MGFDTMRSFQHLILNTISMDKQSGKSTEPTTPMRRTTSPKKRMPPLQTKPCMRRRGAIWSYTNPLDPLDGVSSTSSPPQSPCRSASIPSFQHAKASWSPPPSPRSASPTNSPVSQSKQAQAANSPESPLTPPQSPSLSLSEKSALATQLFHAACTGNTTDMISLLTSGAPLNTPTPVQNLFDAFTPAKPGHLSPLAGAAAHNQLDAVELLLAYGAPLNPSPSASASSPLHEACRSDDYEIARQLLACGADVNLPNSYHATPVMYAAKYSSPALLELLLSYGPDLDRRGAFLETTAVHESIWRGDAAIAELLVRAGAEVCEGNAIAGDTPLHWAVLAEAVEVAAVLIQAGADPCRQNEEGVSPLQAAREAGLEPLVRLMEEVGR